LCISFFSSSLEFSFSEAEREGSSGSAAAGGLQLAEGASAE